MILKPNLLVYYLIIKISDINSWLITKSIIFGIEFKIFKKISYTNNSIAKPKKIRYN